jgi:ParB-like nuclease domain
MRTNGSSARSKETHNKVSILGRGQDNVRLPWPIEMASPHSLRPAERNARTHSKKQIQRIAESMARFGVVNPIIADDRGRIVAGHARAEAAKALGIKLVPVIRVSHLNETEIRAYMLADNRLVEKGGWNRELLAIELGELQIALPEIGLDIGITGFEPGEVDQMMVDFGETQPDPVDDLPDLEPKTVSRSGDLFILGRHRLVVGDARDQSLSLS